MTALEAALRAAIEFLESRDIPYMVIGGVANLVWGVPRATLDIDVTVWVRPDREAGLIQELSRSFSALPEAPARFVEETRVLPLRVEGFKVDVLFGELPYEEQAIRRARSVELAGRRVRVCSPEDLVVHKIVSERPRDLDDVRSLLAKRGKELDRAYLDPIVRGLSEDLSRSAIWELYVSCMGFSGPSGRHDD